MGKPFFVDVGRRMRRLVESKVGLNDLECFRDFHCGNLPHEIPLATWIKEKAAELLKDKSNKTRIWKYELNDAGRSLVGYGSLNIAPLKGTFMEWGDVEKIKIQIIPTMAVHADHKGKGYGHEILDCLIAQAEERLKTLKDAGSPAKPLLGLAVNPKQVAAVTLYRKHGFEDFDYPLVCSYTNDTLQYMIRKIP
jgi:GNAT superfamily N-acetyltransferase